MKKILLLGMLLCGVAHAEPAYLTCTGTHPSGAPSKLAVTLDEAGGTVVFVEDDRGRSVKRPAQFSQTQVLWKHEVVTGMITMNYQLDRTTGEFLSYVTIDKASRGMCAVAAPVERKF